MVKYSRDKVQDQSGQFRGRIIADQPLTYLRPVLSKRNRWEAFYVEELRRRLVMTIQPMFGLGIHHPQLRPS